MSHKNAELDSEIKCHILEDLNHQRRRNEYLNSSEERGINRSRNKTIIAEIEMNRRGRSIKDIERNLQKSHKAILWNSNQVLVITRGLGWRRG